MWTLSNNYNNWEALESEFEWVKDMKQVPQDEIHHAEGNVAIHTEMVLNAMQELEEYKQLEDWEKEILLAAALAHDIEKRSTTQIENGRIISPGHSKKGAQTFRVALFEKYPLAYSLREKLVNLVRYHGFPIWCMEKSNPVKELLKVSLETNTLWLYILAKADMIGRICNDTAAMLERVEFFKFMCIEHDCFGKEKGFSNNNGRFHYFNSQENYVDYQPFENFKSTVHLMSALPGMGKDFFIAQNFDMNIISLDEMRQKYKVTHNDTKSNGQIIQESKQLAKQYLAKGIPFVWNATNITELMRAQLIDMFVTYKAKVIIHYIEKPYKQWLKQNHSRQAKVPENALEKMLFKWQPPSIIEAHEVKYYV